MDGTLELMVVIMAGGRGERLWPSSREDRPKQFLDLDGRGSLLQRTVARLEGLATPVQTWVVTRQDYVDLTLAQLPEIPPEQVIGEPFGRDTAPCIAMVTALASRWAEDAVMVVLPADHMIVQEERFREVLASAISLAKSSDHLVTLGIKPTRPETGYGYVKMGTFHDAVLGHQTYKVEAFKEKPPIDLAIQYLQLGGYLWNSGIFVWKLSSITKALKEHLPQVMNAFTIAGDNPDLGRIYTDLPSVSIDYGVLEKAENTLVIPADFGWDDLGTWAALERVMPLDADGNVMLGNVLAVETERSILRSESQDRLLITFGLSDVVVVDTMDAVLVASKSKSSDLKTLIKALEDAGLSGFLRSPRREVSP